MPEKKMILKIKIDESSTLKQLGMANQFKSVVVTQNTVVSDLKADLLKALSKGLTVEQKTSLEADVLDFQIAEKQDGKIVRRYDTADYPFSGMDSCPTTFIFAKPKKEKSHKLGHLKKHSGTNTVKEKGSKSSKRKSVFGQKPVFDKMGDLTGSSSRYSMSPSSSSPFSLHQSGGYQTERESKPFRQSVPSIPTASDVTLREDQIILMDIVKVCFRGMGIPAHKIQVLEQQTKEVASLHEFFDPPLVKKTLESVQNSLDPGFAKLKDLRIRFFTQNCLRGFICRTRYARFKRDFLPAISGRETPPLGVRLHYIKEMIKNETSFRDRLYFTFNKVERQLKDVSESSDPWISKADWKQVFSESSSFRTIFGRNLKKLEKVYKEDWPDLDWGDICSSIVKEFEENAAKFHGLAIKSQEMTNVLEGMVQRPEFQTFFGQISSDRKSHQYLQGKLHGLHSLIFDPLNRVAYYEGVLRKILELTSNTRKEYHVIEEGLGKLHTMMEIFEEEKIQSKENVRLNLVSTKFGSVAGLDKSVFAFLPSEERGFVFENEMTLLNHDAEKDKWRAHQVQFMAFTDVVVISAESKGCLVMEENGCMLMCQLTIQDMFDTTDPKYPADQTFKITCEPKKDTKVDFILSVKTTVDKKACINRLHPLVKSNRLSFSRPLQEVVDENGAELPNIISIALHSLRQKNAQTLEGIFRIAGEYKYLTQMKAMFDRWRPAHDFVNLEKYDSFDIASLLKQWFRELPEPVLTYAIYDKYVATDDEVDFEEFLEDLPPLNRTVILAVMGFNVELTKYSETNFMTPANIAICWGPTILRPLKEDMTSSMRIPRVNQIVENFVKWCAENPDRLPVLRPPRQKSSSKTSLGRAGSKDTLDGGMPSFASCRPSSGTSTVIRMGSSGGVKRKMGPGLRAMSMMGISPRAEGPTSPSRSTTLNSPQPPISPKPVSPRPAAPTSKPPPPPTSKPPPPPSSKPVIPPKPSSSSSAPGSPAPSPSTSAPSSPAPSSPTPTPSYSAPSSPAPYSPSPSVPTSSRPPLPPSTGARPPLPPPIAALPPPVPGGKPFAPPPSFVPPPAAPPILPPSPSCPASLNERYQEGE